ncbi:MAG: hypothetical protein HYX48_08170 [Chlamydiales bacterium]|nr:hypothetical protein [Chlamydiales bacterium]
MSSPPAAAPQGFFYHLPTYFSTLEGGTDFFDGLEIGCRYGSYLPLTTSQHQLLGEVRASAADVWGLLAIPATLIEAVKWGGELGRFIEVAGSDCSKIEEATRGLFLQSSNLVYSSTKMLSTFQNKRWIDLRSATPWVGGGNCVASLAGDLVDLYDQITRIGEIEQTKRREGVNLAEAGEREWLAIVKIVKDCASIILSAILLGALIFDIVIESVALLPPLLLGLSTIFLVSKLYGYFYERMLDDAKNADPHLLGAV